MCVFLIALIITSCVCVCGCYGNGLV